MVGEEGVEGEVARWFAHCRGLTGLRAGSWVGGGKKMWESGWPTCDGREEDGEESEEYV